MKIINTILGRHYDLTVATDGGGGTSPVEPQIGKISISYANGLPAVVLKYQDEAGTVLLYTTEITWVDGLPTIVETIGEVSGIIKTSILEWVNGSLASVTTSTL